MRYWLAGMFMLGLACGTFGMLLGQLVVCVVEKP